MYCRPGSCTMVEVVGNSRGGSKTAAAISWGDKLHADSQFEPVPLQVRCIKVFVRYEALDATGE